MAHPVERTAEAWAKDTLGVWHSLGAVTGLSIAKTAKFKIELPDGNIISGEAHVVELSQHEEPINAQTLGSPNPGTLAEPRSWSIELSGTGQFIYTTPEHEPVTVLDEHGEPVDVIDPDPPRPTQDLSWVQRLQQKANEQVVEE